MFLYLYGFFFSNQPYCTQILGDLGYQLIPLLIKGLADCMASKGRMLSKSSIQSEAMIQEHGGHPLRSTKMGGKDQERALIIFP